MALSPSELRQFAADYTGRVTLNQVPLNQGGYTSAGVYFGVGPKLYYMADYEGMREEFFRAYDRQEALEMAREVYPKGVFRY
jgi:hypothetical protein